MAEERDRHQDDAPPDARSRSRSRSPAYVRERDLQHYDHDAAPPLPLHHDQDTQPPTTRHADVRPGDWTCPSCAANVFASKNACFKCQTPKPGAPPPNQRGDVRPGDWTCPRCQVNVFASKSACFRCQTPKPDGGGPPSYGGGYPGYAPPPQGGYPAYGGYTGSYGGYGGGGYGGDGGGAYGGYPSYGGVGAPPPSRHSDIRPGDWTCPSCGANVFASKPACFKCHTLKPADGGGGGYGSGSHGGGEAYGGGGGRHADVRPGDWTCPSCEANVFASKQACFKCHTPKPQ